MKARLFFITNFDMKNQLIFILVFISMILKAQKNDYIWVNPSGMETEPSYDLKTIVSDFNILPRKQITNNLGAYTSNAAITAFSDNNGQLLLYSDGHDVYNHSFELIENGFNVSSLQSNVFDALTGYLGFRTMAIFKPNSTDTVLLFSLGDITQFSNGGLYAKHLFATEISTKQNNNAGRVIKKNNPLIKNDSLEEFSLIQHANGRDWWLIVPKNYSNIYYRYLITPDGIEGPYYQVFGTNGYIEMGNKVVSRDGTKYAMSTISSISPGFQGILLYDFDRCTGLFDNEQQIPLNQYNIYTVMNPLAFSPSGKYLYFGLTKQTFDILDAGTVCLQFDVTKSDIKSTIDTIGGTIFGGNDSLWQFFTETFTNAPDGKIYQAARIESYNIIEFPDRKGDSCHFAANVKYGGNPPIGAYNNTPSFPNYRLGPIDGSACDTLGLNNHPKAWFRWDFEDILQKRRCTFTDLSYYEPQTWHWDFGDGMSSTEINPVHIYQNDGVYNVCLIVCNQYSCDTLCNLVYIGVSKTGESEIKKDLFIYPNPAFETFKIGNSNFQNSETKQLQITTPLGQLLKTTQFYTSETTITVADLPAGLVFVQILENGKIIAVGKLVIAR
jgi:PKD domain/Secretion system C-terminal sorting domain